LLNNTQKSLNGPL